MGSWVELGGFILPRFLTQVKSLILPDSYRIFDTSTMKWSVHLERRDMLLNLAKKHYGEDLELIGFNVVTEGPFKELFVTSDAPFEVIKASYKALSSKYHPDKGGTEEDMIRLNQAYANICKLKGIL
jgi:hypothetical protein